MLNKKQVKALLEVISNDDSRPALCVARLDIYNDMPVLVATNSYILAAMYIQIDQEVFQTIQGQCVTREALTKWYKLATNKDYFNGDTIIELATESTDKFPQWQQLISDTAEVAISISFNAQLALTLQTLDNSPGLTYRLKSKNGPMTAETANGIYLLMPLKQ